MNWSKILVGAIALALLDAFLTNRAASSNVGSAELGASSILGKFLDAGTPAFAGGKPSSSSSSSSSGSSSSSSSSTSTPTNGNAGGPGGPIGPGPIGPGQAPAGNQAPSSTLGPSSTPLESSSLVYG